MPKCSWCRRGFEEELYVFMNGAASHLNIEAEEGRLNRQIAEAA